MIAPVRSWLYVPGHRPELLAKAMAGDADAVVFDLEDAVAPGSKDEARRNAVLAAAEEHPKPLWVRVNSSLTPWGKDDLVALAGSGVSGLRIPKAEDPAAIVELAEAVGVPLHLLLETALGVENAFLLARCHPRVVIVSLGEADLRADLRIRDADALEWARQRVINADRAAGLASPPHAVWTDVADRDGLEADTRKARDRGFFGRSVVHPGQIEPVNRLFSPDPAEVEAARALLGSLDDRSGGAVSAWLDERGRFVDPAVVAGARWVVDLADAVNPSSPDSGKKVP